MTTEIRKAVATDENALITLLYEMHSETDYRHFPVKESKARVAIHRWIDQPDAVLFLAFEEGTLIGIVAGSLFSPWFSDHKKTMEQLFFVTKNKRGSGAATELFSHFLAWAKTQSKFVSAGVTTSVGGSAESIYAKFGMKYTGSNFAMEFTG